MDANQYCDSMYSELTAIRSRLYGIIRQSMTMDDADKQRVSPQLTDMNTLVDDLSQKVDSLKRECPAEWSQQRQDIESARGKLQEKINYWDAEHIAGGYLP